MERQQRVLGLPERARGLSPAAKTALLFAGLAPLVAAVAWLDPRPSLRHVRATMLSGSGKQSLSMLVPMGEEMAYRSQETLIADTLHALRAYRGRIA